MFKKILFSLLLLILALALFTNPTIQQVAAGVSILLFGMMMLESGFNIFVDGPLQRVISRSTNKLYKSLTLGFASTAILQSSSLISVIAISFISAGIITLKAGVGIIFGANMGTTATAWLVSIFGLKFEVSALAMPMLAFGIIFNFQNSKKLQGLGNILAGLGFFFLGIYFMKEGFDGISNDINLSDYALPGLLGRVVYCGIGIFITMILQSSSATMALTLTALAFGQIDYANSLALAIGANIGTTITAILGSLGANISGKRLAAAHLIFNLFTGVLALIFITQLAALVDIISVNTGISVVNYTIKLSIFHSLFNLVGVILFLPLINPMIHVLEKRLIDPRPKKDDIEYPVYLNESIMVHPQSAYQALFNETKRLFEETTFMIVAHGLNLHREDIRSDEKLKHVIKRSVKEMPIDIEMMYYNKVKIIYSKIIKFATLAQSTFSLSPQGLNAFTHIKLASRNIVDVIKELRGLRKNVSYYMTSENKYMRQEYNKLRTKVSKVLREIHATAEDANPKNHLAILAGLKEQTDKNDILIDGTLDRLIREQRISSVMATSLANDSENVDRIIKKLIEIAELLYINTDTHLVA